MGDVMKARRERVYVLPGNHESASDIANFCGRFGFLYFYGATGRDRRRVRFAGLGHFRPSLPSTLPANTAKMESPSV